MADQPTETHSEPPKTADAPRGGGSAHAADGMAGPHGSMDDHGADHGHDDHAHGMEASGPIDLRAWGYGVAGAGLGIVVVIALALGSGSLG